VEVNDEATGYDCVVSYMTIAI